jgi:diketogulonate reductase-like aldo/keto reductase
VSALPTRPFGLTGARVSVLGEGTWNMERDPSGEAIRAIPRALAVGMTHIDTAEMYGRGRVEQLVGKAIDGLRDRAFLASTVLPGNANRKGTISACEASLRRLGTDHLDLYLLHWWQGDYPLEHTFESFERLREQGKIRFWGVSNFSVPELERALAIVGPGRIACNQVLYHLGERGVEHAVLPWCEAQGVALVGYSPFGSGDFPAADSPGGRVLARIAAEHGATPRQVALAFLTRRPALFSIPKSSRVPGVIENAGGARIQLSDAQIGAIDVAFPLGPPPDGVPML